MEATPSAIFKARPIRMKPSKRWLTCTKGVDKLIVGSKTTRPYGLPGLHGKQRLSGCQGGPVPFVTATSWNILKAGLNYPTCPAPRITRLISTKPGPASRPWRLACTKKGLNLADGGSHPADRPDAIFQPEPAEFPLDRQPGWLGARISQGQWSGRFHERTSAPSNWATTAQPPVPGILSFNTSSIPDNASSCRPRSGSIRRQCGRSNPFSYWQPVCRHPQGQFRQHTACSERLQRTATATKCQLWRNAGERVVQRHAEPDRAQ